MNHINLEDPSLTALQPTDRVKALRHAYFEAMPEVCLERVTVVTEFSRDHGLFKKDRISPLDKANLYRHLLAKHSPILWPDQAMGKGRVRMEIPARSLFVGSTTTRFKGVALYPEFMGLALWSELHELPTRAANPYWITEEEIQILNEDLFPQWMNANLVELCRAQCQGPIPGNVDWMQLFQHLVFFILSKPNCISHTIPDFQRVLHDGAAGIMAEARGKAASAGDPETKDFYSAMALCLEGLCGYSDVLAKVARDRMASESDPAILSELRDLVEIHEQVPRHPARTFREALTTIWLCWIAVHQENPDVGLSLGRLDQILYPFYLADRKAGRLSLDFAIELLCCLWLKIGDHVPSVPSAGEQLFGGAGSNQAITVGGVDSDEKDAVNELTYVILRATEIMKLRDPNLNARVYPGKHDPRYLRRLCEVNRNTGSTPAIHNDRAVVKALIAKGDKPEQALDYGIVGCVEPASNGRSYGASGAILLNLSSVLELTLWNGRHRHTGLATLVGKPTGEPRTFASFMEFKHAFQQQASWMADGVVWLNNELGKVHQRYYPTPLLSALFEGPMENGKDLIFGGATLNSSGVAIIGFADVVDSLAAIEKLVFQEKSLTMDALLKALESDFAGQDALVARLRNPEKTPIYGNEHPSSESIALWLAEMLDGIFVQKENYRGGHYRVGYWTMTNHAGFGHLAPSTPNGRKKGENFSSGITPVSGVTPALTPALHSVARIPANLLGNGVALNLKYSPAWDSQEDMLAAFVATVNGYFDSGNDGVGGMEIQFNVISREVLVEAMNHPGTHPDLLVRVSGYTAYFKDLNPQMQREILERTEYNLRTGHAIPPSGAVA